MMWISVVLSLCFMMVSSNPTSPIEHVVVVMMENRAFDHMLGYMHKLNPKVDGLTGQESNPVDPQVPSLGQVKVSFDAPNHIEYNPGHSVSASSFEIYGHPLDTAAKPFPKPKMDGFIAEPGAGGRPVMRCYNSTSLPAMYTLAQQFALFDQWHASVPGPTEVNRMFVASAQSYGAADNDEDGLIAGYPQRTFFNQLADENLDFGVYFSDFPTMFFLRETRQYLDSFHDIDEFYDDARWGRLPPFSFLEPRYFNLLDWLESDQHPHFDSKRQNGNIILGEKFISDVYAALRASPNWNSTLFIVTYDEHGGLYDHVPPPQTDIPQPTDRVSADPPFNFDRLGVRVPAIMASPWLDQGLVISHNGVKPKSSSAFEHSSIMATVRRLFGMKSPPLTARDAWAATFENIFRSREEGPRTDTPTHLPVSPLTDDDRAALAAYQRGLDTPMTDANLKEALRRRGGVSQARAEADQTTDFQQAMVLAAAGLTMDGPDDLDAARTLAKSVMHNEMDAALFVRQQMKTFLEGKEKNTK